MHSNFFCLLIVLLLQICKAKYQCANDTEIICDDKCMALVDMFHRENAIRYIYEYILVIIILIINLYLF